MQVTKAGRINQYKVQGKKIKKANATQTLMTKNLAKGNYAIRYRVQIVSGNKKAYTKWSGKKTLKLK